MNLAVALDFRFHATPDGSVWTRDAFGYSFWTRYLDVFRSVRIIARAEPVGEPHPGARRVDGGSVSVWPVPYYRGALQYLVQSAAVRRAAGDAVAGGGAVILRVGSELACRIAPALQRIRRPYGLEVVGDPYGAFAPGAIQHPLRPLLRWRYTRALRRQCAGACGVAYVTGSALQGRYPCPRYMTSVSDVELPAEFWDPLLSPGARGGRRLIFVGSLEQMYKGPDVLLDAFAICLRQDPAFRLTIAGEGRHLEELLRRAAALGIQGAVRFVGRLTPREVREELDRSSLFVLPSRTEGLPRAMLEAMARGLPCIGTTAGGIPELLEPEDMVPVGDYAALARRILEVMANAGRIERMSERNRRTAERYRDELLRPRRNAFYREVLRATGEWRESTSLP